MQDWQDRFTNHAVHQKITQINGDINADDLKEIDEVGKAGVERFKVALGYAETALANTVPFLVSIPLLDRVNEHLTTAHHELGNFRSNKEYGHLKRANHELDEIIQLVQRLPSPQGAKKDKSLTALINFYSDAMEKNLAEMRQNKELVAESLVDVKNTIEKLRSDVGTIGQTLESQQTSITNLSATYQEQFSNQQEERRKEFATYIDETKISISAHLDEVSKKMDDVKQALQDSSKEALATLAVQAESLIDKLKDKEVQASKLLESVGIKSQTYLYAGVSQQERNTAKWLRVGAISLMLFAVLIVIAPAAHHIYMYWNSTEVIPDFKWENVLYRIPASLIIFAPALYMAAESSKHRKREVENKRIELELAALNPYMELFENADKVKIKESLVEKYFVGHSRTESSSEAQKSAWLDEIVPKVLDKVLERFFERFPSLKG